MKSIKTKGILFSICLILCVITTMGYTAYSKFEKILVDEVNRAVVRVANESAAHLSSYLVQFLSPLEAIANNEDIISMNWEKQREIIGAQISPNYLNIAVVDLDGMAYYVDDTILDLSDREYIQKTLAGNITYSEAIISRKTQETVIMVGVPIYKGNQIQGALIARLDVNFLSDFAVSRGYGENGRAYIISEAGTLISQPKQSEVADIYNIYEITKENNDYNDFIRFIEENKSNTSGYGKFEYNQKTMLMAYSSVEGTDWKIYVGTIEEEALASLYNLAETLIVGIFISIIISSILAGIVINRFTKPIIELDKLFLEGASGNLNIRFTPKSKDEIGRVGSSFNLMMDKIKTLTQFDPLTSLLNQFVLENEVDSMLHSEEVKDFTLTMIAIDKFSLINETYGYTSGDAVLKEVAGRILLQMKGNEQLYRYKGDEFVILYRDNLSDYEVYRFAHKILESLRDGFDLLDKTISINISIGIFQWQESTRAQEPLKAVTNAMNYAKFRGSNQIQLFDQKVHDSLVDMRKLQAEIPKAIKEEQFFLVYQPLISLTNEKIAEIESLIRWNHPQRGIVYPDNFIELAEQNGTIIDIDLWVLETACKQLQVWQEYKKEPVIISVNITAKTFETRNFIQQLTQLIKKYDINPTLLQLEITERMVIKNVDESILKLNDVRAMGIRVAIDDFGIGYSSLSYLVRLPIDSLKIDKSFIDNISNSKEAKAIVSAIINLCRDLNLKVIAEGVETVDQLHYLKKIKCDIGQGYYFSKPVSLMEIEEKYLN